MRINRLIRLKAVCEAGIRTAHTRIMACLIAHESHGWSRGRFARVRDKCSLREQKQSQEQTRQALIHASSLLRQQGPGNPQCVYLKGGRGEG